MSGPQGLALRLEAYRRAARALNRFFARWTAPLCARCLEVTRASMPGEPGADVELVAGVFPGCCQAGVADGLWIPGAGEGGRFPPDLAGAFVRARERACPERPAPPGYTVRERPTGRVARGVGCAYLGPGGCRLGEWKAPLCLTFLCRGALDALAGVLGEGVGRGGDTDDFAGSSGVLRAVVLGEPGELTRAVDGLEARLAAWDRTLRERATDGRTLADRWLTARAPGPPAGRARPERWNARE